jgi:hypothetical protein
VNTTHDEERCQEMEPLEEKPGTTAAVEIGDVDELIRQLETQYEGSHVLPVWDLAPTNGCTAVKGCTGTCPCGA